MKLNSFKTGFLPSKEMRKKLGLPWQLSRPSLGLLPFDRIFNSSKKRKRDSKLG
jgi:hypothetical protein